MLVDLSVIHRLWCIYNRNQRLKANNHNNPRVFSQSDVVDRIFKNWTLCNMRMSKLIVTWHNLQQQQRQTSLTWHQNLLTNRQHSTVSHINYANIKQKKHKSVQLSYTFTLATQSISWLPTATAVSRQRALSPTCWTVSALRGWTTATGSLQLGLASISMWSPSARQEYYASTQQKQIFWNK